MCLVVEINHEGVKGTKEIRFIWIAPGLVGIGIFALSCFLKHGEHGEHKEYGLVTLVCVVVRKLRVTSEEFS